MSLRSILSGFLLALAVAGVACHSSTSPSPTVSAVSVTGATPAVGNSAQFDAMAMDSDNTTKDVTTTATWTSSDTSVATVSSSGLVTAVATGTAVITATYSSVVGQDTITVS